MGPQSFSSPSSTSKPLGNLLKNLLKTEGRMSDLITSGDRSLSKFMSEISSNFPCANEKYEVSKEWGAVCEDFFLQRQLGELMRCCYNGKSIQNAQILGTLEEEVGKMVFTDEWGITYTSEEPFRSIKPIDPRKLQGRKVFRRQYAIWFPASSGFFTS